MSELFVRKEVTIHVPASKVWDVLVKQVYLKHWIKIFSEGMVINEDWQQGSKVEMTDDDGNIIYQGTITVFNPPLFLKIEFEGTKYSETLKLSPRKKGTLLSAQAGPLEETAYEEHTLVWDKGLQKIKELAEAQ